MTGWLFPYKIWYALGVFWAGSAALSAASGDIPDATVSGLMAAVVGVTALRSRVRWSRSGEKALRAELARLVDERAASGAVAWLNRDEGLLFGADLRRVAGMQTRDLTVMDEELLRDVNDARLAGGGKVAATFTGYRVHPVFARVPRLVDGVSALVTAADVEEAAPEERVPWRRRCLGTVRILRSGQAFADAGELAGVIAQFRDAEPAGRDEDTA